MPTHAPSVGASTSPVGVLQYKEINPVIAQQWEQEQISKLTQSIRALHNPNASLLASETPNFLVTGVSSEGRFAVSYAGTKPTEFKQAMDAILPRTQIQESASPADIAAQEDRDSTHFFLKTKLLEKVLKNIQG